MLSLSNETVDIPFWWFPSTLADFLEYATLHSGPIDLIRVSSVPSLEQATREA